MPWPPTIPPNTRTNNTITEDNHPSDHNETSDALSDVVTEVDLKAPKAGPVFTGQASFAAGTAAAPSITFTGDLNTGVFQPGSDVVGISAGGTERLTISTTLHTSTVPYVAPVGGVGAPAFYFTGDANTGLYWIGADSVGVSTGGTLRLSVDTAAVTSTLPVVHPVGSAAAPSITFAGDLNTGVYQLAADQIGFAVNGAFSMGLGATGIIGQVFTSDLVSSTDIAGYDNVGARATALGYRAGAAVTNEGADNTFVGYQSGYQSDYLNESTLIGSGAGRSLDVGASLSVATAVGFDAGRLSGAVHGTFLGHRAGYNADGTSSTYIGKDSGENATGSYQVGIGEGALRNSSCTTSMAIGFYSQGSATGNASMSMGFSALQSNTGASCVGIGYEAGLSNSAANLTAIGREAAKSLVTPGTHNTMLGFQAGYTATNHNQSTLVGGLAGYDSDLGSAGSVTAVGYRAGYDSSGLSLTALGESAGDGNTHASVILIGRSAAAAAANEMVIGSASYAANRWIPGHDPDTYLDWATADTVKHYAGGVKVLEINETGAAPFMGFFGTTAVAKPTGVAVTAAGVHAALVTLGLIAA